MSTSPSVSLCSIPISFTDESPTGLGLKGDLVANTPIRLLPPRRGGLTVGDHVSLFASENSQINHKWEKSSMPRRASRTLYSGSNTILARSESTSPLWRGIPNFSLKSVLIFAITFIWLSPPKLLPLLYHHFPENSREKFY